MAYIANSTEPNQTVGRNTYDWKVVRLYLYIHTNGLRRVS